MPAAVIAKTEAGIVGGSNTIPNSIQGVSIRVPCYCGYALQEGDSDKEKKWGGVVTAQAGDWVARLQADLIGFGIERYGLVVEKKIPQPSKTVKNRKTGKSESVPQPPLVEWQKAKLGINGVFDEATTAALKLFQWHAKKVGIRRSESAKSCVDISYFGPVDGIMSEAVCAEMKVWRSRGFKIIRPQLDGVTIKVDQTKFRALYESNPRKGVLIFEALPDTFFKNLCAVLNNIASDSEIQDICWASYMLATLLHECRSAANKWKCTWAPVPETPDRDGKYHGGSYGNPEFVVNRSGKKIDETGAVVKNESQASKRQYFGRGFVQLTHQDNYRKFSELLGLGVDLQFNPEKVLEADVAYKIMSIGMRGGNFIGGQSLSKHIGPSKVDYLSARKIINTDGSRVEASAPTLAGKKLSNGGIVSHYADIFEWIIFNSFVYPA
jgi:putative chitinase